MRRLLLVLSLAVLFAACENDAYDAGDGALSYMRADFVEASTDASARFVSIVTDDDERFVVSPSFECKWAEKPDTVYRALLYYNKVEAPDGSVSAQPVSMSPVMTPKIRPYDDVEELPATDPVTLVSAWRSRNGKYVNLELSVKTGNPDDENIRHVLGLLYEGVERNGSGGKRMNLLLTHNRMGMPEYYSVTAFVSIPVSDVPGVLSGGDEIAVRVSTYGGMVTKIFSF